MGVNNQLSKAVNILPDPKYFGKLPTECLKDNTKPMLHQIEHALALTDTLSVNQVQKHLFLSGSEGRFKDDVYAYLNRMQRRGLVVKIESKHVRGPSLYKLSKKASVKFHAPAYIPYFTRAGNQKRARKLLDNPLSKGYRNFEMLFDSVPFDMRDDIQADTICFLLEGGSIKDVGDFIKNQKRENYHLSALNRFSTTRLDGYVYEGESEMTRHDRLEIKSLGDWV